jgi:cysteinyl-tRNA synthetase
MKRVILLALMYPLILSCSTNPTRAALLNQVNDFLLQLQNYDLNSIKSSRYDLVVMDYSSGAGPWSPQDIRTLKSSEGGKIVLAYLSIGEAEDYRFYWHSEWVDEGFADPDRPPWLGRVNPGWPGNYKVKYWDPDWQGIVLTYLDRILDQGFDGVYMDIVDAYWYWSNEAAAAGETEQLASIQDAADRMVDFIIAIATHCRVSRGEADFLLCPQNGSFIVHDASIQRAAAFWSVIDAIGAEDTFFFGNLDEDNPYNPQNSVILNLDGYVDAGKKVLATDYLSESNTGDIDTFYSLCRSHGYIPFAGSRNLDSLRINPGHEPD